MFGGKSGGLKLYESLPNKIEHQKNILTTKSRKLGVVIQLKMNMWGQREKNTRNLDLFVRGEFQRRASVELKETSTKRFRPAA